MKDMFTVDTKDLKKLIKQYSANAREFKSAMINVLNTQAFGTRIQAMNVIKKDMTVRKSKLVDASLRVQKAKYNNMQSEVGSVYRNDFSGWKEQETGEKTKRKRVPTKAARRNDIKKVIAPSLRMKTLNKFISDKTTIGTSKSDFNRTIAMVSYIRRNKYRKPFILSTGGDSYNKGLYKLIGNKIKLIQDLGDIDKSVAKIPWMLKAKNRFFRKNAPIKLWNQSIVRIVSFRKK